MKMYRNDIYLAPATLCLSCKEDRNLWAVTEGRSSGSAPCAPSKLPPISRIFIVPKPVPLSSQSITMRSSLSFSRIPGILNVPPAITLSTEQYNVSPIIKITQGTA